MLHLDQNGMGNQNAAVDFLKNVRTAKANEVIKRARTGDNDHACYNRLFFAASLTGKIWYQAVAQFWPNPPGKRLQGSGSPT